MVGWPFSHQQWVELAKPGAGEHVHAAWLLRKGRQAVPQLHMQLKSLQYATNSFNYTVSLIQGQNTIERLWPRICEIQKTNTALFQDATFRASLAPQVSDYQLTIPANYSDDMQINVAWVDKRMTDNAENQISLNASFPDLTAVCS